MSGDPERDPKARPTAPAGVLGGPGKRPESAPVETGRVPKSAFAHTIAMPTAAPMPPSEPEKLNVPRGTSDAAEPLREPSERPAPTPYKRANNAYGGTMPMPELNTPPGARSEERMIAAKPGMRVDSSPVEVRGATKVGTPARGEASGRMPTAGNMPSPLPPSNRSSSLPAAPPPSGAPPAIPSLNAAAKSPAPAAPARDDHSVPRLSLGVEKIPSGTPAAKLDTSGMSQPLQLSLSASDHVESSIRPEARVPSRSSTPWIIGAVILIVAVVAFAMTRGGEEPAAVAPERVEAVPAVDPPAAAPSTDTPQAVAPTAPTTPSAPVVAPAKPAPVAPAKLEAKEEAEDAPPAKASTTTKRKARRTKKPAAKAEGPVLKVSPEGESDLEKALEAAERMAEPEDELEPPEPPSAEPPSPD